MEVKNNNKTFFLHFKSNFDTLIHSGYLQSVSLLLVFGLRLLQLCGVQALAELPGPLRLNVHFLLDTDQRVHGQCHYGDSLIYAQLLSVEV